MIPKDYNERLAAALPGDQNIIVEAGAGTGKTTLLADRLCYLILGKGLKTDEIVALPEVLQPNVDIYKKEVIKAMAE